MSVSIRIRRDTSANWALNDPVLFAGEIALDLTAKRVKLGDGFNEWSNLEYLNDSELAAIRSDYGNETDFIIEYELSKS